MGGQGAGRRVVHVLVRRLIVVERARTRPRPDEKCTIVDTDGI